MEEEFVRDELDEWVAEHMDEFVRKYRGNISSWSVKRSWLWPKMSSSPGGIWERYRLIKSLAYCISLRKVRRASCYETNILVQESPSICIGCA